MTETLAIDGVTALWVLLIIGAVVLAIVIVVGWGILKLAGDIDQHREDWHGERRS